jgi:hypothetical protein
MIELWPDRGIIQTTINFHSTEYHVLLILTIDSLNVDLCGQHIHIIPHINSSVISEHLFQDFLPIRGQKRDLKWTQVRALP